MRYLDDEQIKKLAVDVRAGRVFGSWMIGGRIEDIIQSIFIPLLFMDKKNKEQMVKDEVYYIYEYYDKAGPRSINGYPTFTSFHMLTKEDTEILKKMVDRLENAERRVLGE